MAKQKNVANLPAMSPEGRENQLISLAVNLAEQRLMDGTASSQLITHYLELATTREKLKVEKLKKENALIEAKTEAYSAMRDSMAQYEEAVRAFKTYSGQEEINYEDQNIF